MNIFRKLFFSPPKPGKPIPVTDESFQKQTLESEIPSVVEFWSPRCSHCQVMNGLLDEIGPDYAGRLAIFKLNVIQNPKTTDRYGVRATPTLIFFREGYPVDRIVGLLPLKPLKAKFDNLIDKSLKER